MKHTKAKYFFIKDYYDAWEIDVKFCPTNKMRAGKLTKPLQNCPKDYNEDIDLNILMKPQDAASLQECVDEHATRGPRNQANHKPRAPHVCHESHGTQMSSENSQ